MVMGRRVYLLCMFICKSWSLMVDDFRCTEQHLHLHYSTFPIHSALSSCCFIYKWQLCCGWFRCFMTRVKLWQQQGIFQVNYGLLAFLFTTSCPLFWLCVEDSLNTSTVADSGCLDRSKKYQLRVVGHQCDLFMEKLFEPLACRAAYRGNFIMFSPLETASSSSWFPTWEKRPQGVCVRHCLLWGCQMLTC